jgi:hypothetical protein
VRISFGILTFMFSPLFTEVADTTAKEYRAVEVVPEGHEPLAEPFNNLSLRQKPDDQPSPYEIARHYSGSGGQSVLPPVAGKRLKLVLKTVETDRAVSSIEEAELAVLNLTYQSTNVMRFDGKRHGSCVGDINAAFAILINRAANVIAARTRRGAGNLVFMHPDSLKIITSMTTNAFRASSEEETVGLWAMAGVLNGCMVVYTNPDFTMDRAVVVYQGWIGDGPAQLLNRDGKTFLAIHDNALDYVGTVLIEQ